MDCTRSASASGSVVEGVDCYAFLVCIDEHMIEHEGKSPEGQPSKPHHRCQGALASSWFSLVRERHYGTGVRMQPSWLSRENVVVLLSFLITNDNIKFHPHSRRSKHCFVRVLELPPTIRVP